MLCSQICFRFNSLSTIEMCMGHLNLFISIKFRKICFLKYNQINKIKAPIAATRIKTFSEDRGITMDVVNEARNAQAIHQVQYTPMFYTPGSFLVPGSRFQCTPLINSK